jgi:uncharacterized protein (DUF433 family)
MAGISVYTESTAFNGDCQIGEPSRDVVKGIRRKEGNYMAALDWSQCAAVESVPHRRSGERVFKDTRMPVATVFENLQLGASIQEIIDQYDVTREQIQAVLKFTARSLDAPPVPIGAASLIDAHPV